MRKVRTAAALIVLAAVVSCATASSDVVAYRTLGSIKVAVDTGMKIYASQVVAGKVSQAVQLQVQADYKKYQDAFALAGSAIQSWKTIGGAFPDSKIAEARAAASKLPNVQVP